jgi:hypothetical protein
MIPTRSRDLFNLSSTTLLPITAPRESKMQKPNIIPRIEIAPKRFMTASLYGGFLKFDYIVIYLGNLFFHEVAVFKVLFPAR